MAPLRIFSNRTANAGFFWSFHTWSRYLGFRILHNYLCRSKADFAVGITLSKVLTAMSFLVHVEKPSSSRPQKHLPEGKRSFTPVERILITQSQCFHRPISRLLQHLGGEDRPILENDLDSMDPHHGWNWSQRSHEAKL